MNAPPAYQIEAQVRNFASSHGVTLPANLVCDSELHRFRVEDRKPGNADGWYVVHSDGCPNWIVGVHGRSPGDGWRGRFDFEAAGLSAAVPAPHELEPRETENARQKEQAAAIERARALYASAGSVDPSHPYLQRKQIVPHAEMRQTEGRLLIPWCDVFTGEFLTLQSIYKDGQKRWAHGCPKRGAYIIGADIPGDVLLAEGLATGATLSEALAASCTVVVAGDAGSLPKVAPDVRKRWPDRKIYVAADNDKSGTGLKAAQKAVQTGHLDGILLPKFKDSAEDSDWNDFARLYGHAALVEEVLCQKKNPIVPLEPQTEFNTPVQSSLAGAVSLSDFYTKGLDPNAPPTEFIGGLFPRGTVSLLYGKAGCGKTLFLHSFVSQLAQGGVLLGGVIRTEPEAPRRVLFFEGDADVSLFNERVRAFRFETPSNLRFVFLGNLQKNGLDLDLGSLEGQNLLARFVDDFLPDVIVIDTIQSFHTKDENDSTQMKTVLTSLVRLSSERKLAAVLIHHARKSPPQFSNARLGDEAAQGTNMFLRRAGTVLALEKLASGEKIIHSLSIKKSWYGATRDDIAGFEIGPNFYEDGLSLHYIRAPQINAPNPGGRPSKREAIRDTIATLEGEITLSNLVEVLPGVSRATIQSVLSAMVERGELTRTGHGKNVGYRLNL